MADNNNTLSNLVDFGAPDKKHSIIKVIGVGGGGGNAVNHMYREGMCPSCSATLTRRLSTTPLYR